MAQLDVLESNLDDISLFIDAFFFSEIEIVIYFSG